VNTNTGARGRTRSFDLHAVTAVAPVVALLPAWALAVTFLWWVTSAFHDLPLWSFAVGHLALGVILFIRPLQPLVLGRMFDARKPTAEERVKIQRSWLRVAQRNHVRRNDYVFAIVDSEDLNAFACGGHLVVVSGYAVNSLSDEELTGVLAHELSHHLGFHTFALTVGQWLSVPVVLLARLGFLLQRLADSASERLRSRSDLLATVGRAVALLMQGTALVFLADLLLAQAVGNIVGRRAEFAADRRVIEMGFGRELARALRRVVADGGGERATSWADRIVTSHPPARTRVARIEAALRADERRRRR
jgi:Zn-dependent protease with chaperone function